eukprot:m.149593 g.149593  ORF g.149593 m.149593 type:complete len:102 (-) comp13271_c1_seq19:1220-1525(-)
MHMSGSSVTALRDQQTISSDATNFVRRGAFSLPFFTQSTTAKLIQSLTTLVLEDLRKQMNSRQSADTNTTNDNKPQHTHTHPFNVTPFVIHFKVYVFSNNK